MKAHNKNIIKFSLRLLMLLSIALLYTIYVTGYNFTIMNFIFYVSFMWISAINGSKIVVEVEEKRQKMSLKIIAMTMAFKQGLKMPTIIKERKLFRKTKLRVHFHPEFVYPENLSEIYKELKEKLIYIEMSPDEKREYNKKKRLEREAEEERLKKEKEGQELLDALQDFFGKRQKAERILDAKEEKERKILENSYKLFRISKSDDLDTIKKVYRQFVVKWHPDKWTHSSEQNQQIAERNFKKGQTAYENIKKDKNIV